MFARPKVFSTVTIHCFDANQQRILRILSRPDLDFEEVERLIKSDPVLSYRLLRFLNSSAFYLQSEIRSIFHALTLLGQQEARKWLLLASAVLGLRSKRPHLLAAMPVRARFSELFGEEAELPGSSPFILGFLSLMDAALNIEKSVLADQVAFSEEIREALKGKHNRLEQFFQLVISYESAEWLKLNDCAENGEFPHTPSHALISKP